MYVTYINHEEKIEKLSKRNVYHFGNFTVIDVKFKETRIIFEIRQIGWSIITLSAKGNLFIKLKIKNEV